MYALIINGAVSKYPYSMTDLQRDNPQTSFPSSLPPERFADYSMLPVAPSAPPPVTIYEKTVEGTPALIGGQWTQTWTVVAADVPSYITPRQCRLVLMQQGLLAQVEQMIAQQDEATRITWEYALEFRRDDPLLNALAQNLGLTDQQIDEFFVAAAQL
jgi:hypothetical protein